MVNQKIVQKILEFLERKFQSGRPYKFKHGIKMKDGMSICQEITIIKIVTQKLAAYCITANL